MPIGGEDVSTQLQLVGQKQSFAFEPKDHLQLGEDLDLIDFETGGVVRAGGGGGCQGPAVLTAPCTVLAAGAAGRDA